MTITGLQRMNGPRLQRRLGLWSITLSGVGIVLGAGIYVLVGEASAEAGNSTWIAFLVAAALAGLTGLAFAELSAMFPEAGASAIYASKAFGERIGFLTGWLDVSVNVIGAAAVALGFGGYLEDVIGWDRRLIALIAVSACALIVYSGVRETVGLAVVFALAEASGLVFVIIVGAPALREASFFTSANGIPGVLGASALVFFAYEGFEEIASLAEEAREPTWTIPRAIILAVGVTSVLYVLVAMVATAVVPWEQLSQSNAPLALVVKTATNERLGDALGLIALFATFNTVLLLLATGARVVYGMANRQLFPEQLGRVSRHRGTPWVATIAVTLVASVFLSSGDIGYVAQVTNFAVFGQFLAVNGAVIALRVTEPTRPRPFRTRMSVSGIPVPAALAIAGTSLFALFMDRHALLTGTAALLLGFALSFIALRRAPKE
jgi:basic amino acid/polyamine antiporter, APA family